MCAPNIPDPGPQQIAAINLQDEIANKNLALQDKTMQYFMDRQNKLDPLQEEVTQRQMANADTTAQQGADVFNYQKQVFRPVEESMVAQAMQESTPQFYDQYAQEAAARMGQAQAGELGTFDRGMSSMGVNPNSGAYVAGRRGLELSDAAQLGGTMNDARDKAEALGFARKADVAGLGKGLVGAGNASYGLAMQGDASALQGANDTSRTAGATIGTPVQYGSEATTAGMNMGTLANDVYRTQVNGANANNSDGLWNSAGTALGSWASTGFKF